jgi:hypothetical protein
VDILLSGRDNLILFCSLQSWQFLDRLRDDIQSILNLLFADDERRCKTNYVLVGRFGL